MAEACHLWLKANGVDIQGDSTVTSMGRENTIECLKFEHTVQTPRETGSGMATGKRVHSPITITKRYDRSTPLLYKALAQNEKIDATIKFYRPNPTGDGTTEQFFTIELKNGRISSIKSLLPYVLDPNTSMSPNLEEVSFVYQTIIWTYVPTGATHDDDWTQSA
jgi:type VI secretion system secreted protein Hcp